VSLASLSASATGAQFQLSNSNFSEKTTSLFGRQLAESRASYFRSLEGPFAATKSSATCATGGKVAKLAHHRPSSLAHFSPKIGPNVMTR